MLRNLSNRLGPALTALAGAVVALALMFTYLQLNPPDGRYTDGDIQRLADERIEDITPTPPIEPAIYALVRPSVVTILRADVPEDLSVYEGKLGSGVIVDESGAILTNHHVVTGPGPINVLFADGSRKAATLEVEEPDRDLAVIRVNGLPQDMVPATLAGGGVVGDQVMALGAPYGYVGSFSSGVISGLNRTVAFEDPDQVLTGLIQFDAAVNPGSSGGALIDMGGRVIGIVTAIATEDGGFNGLGFAIPIDSAGGALPAID